jgi:tryptophan synthase alpha chain
VSRLSSLFERTRRERTLALFPYLTAGFPDDAACEELLVAAAASGAAGLEVGIPFSDPLADGVTLQRASQAALSGGATLQRALDLAARVNRRANVPIVFMSYLNPLLAYGFERFCAAAAAAGVDGLIVPDVPLEEADSFQREAAVHGIDYIYMLAPTSTRERVRAVAERATGFIYCVALVGVTGARSAVADGLEEFLAAIRLDTTLPLLVGFGISKPEHVRRVQRAGADAVVVASALVDLVERTEDSEKVQAVRGFVRDLQLAASAPAG